jgi:hypothetical protein
MSVRASTILLFLAVARTASADCQETLRSYAIDYGQSSLFIVVHRAGLFSFLGHEHSIVPEEWRAQLCMADSPPRSAHGSVVIQSGSLVIDTDTARALAGLGDGPGADDMLEIQRKMLDADHLDSRGYPEITLGVDSVGPASGGALAAFGRLTLRGVTRDVSVPMRIEFPNDATTRLTGVLRVRQRDFGIEPESKAGLVKVSNDVDLHFLLVAAPTDRPCGRPEP